LAWPDPKQFAVQSLHLFHFFIGFLIVLDSEESWVCVKIDSFFFFWLLLGVVGGGMGSWEVEASEAGQFDWVLL
jgi:hypothetical protein